MPDQPLAPMSTEDFQQVHQMSLSPDAGVRAQASKIASTFSPDEQQQFFNVQQAANRGKEGQRVDNSILGMPPEAVAAGVAPIAAAASGPGLDVAGRVVAGVKSALSQATPVVKYQVTKGLLEHLGIPQSFSIPIAMVASGYKIGKGSAPEPAAPSAAAAPSVAAPAATAAPEMINGVNVDDLRAAGVAEKAINRMRAEASAPPPTATRPVPPAPASLPPPMLTSAAPGAAAPPPPPAAASVATAPGQGLADLSRAATKLKLTGSEYKQLDQWVRSGVPVDKAIERLTLTRQLQGSSPFANLPTNLDTLKDVADRNVMGHW